MQEKRDGLTQDLLRFLDACPTSWHAVAEVKKKLQERGFVELKEEQKWDLQPGRRYFVTRNNSSVCAFVTPLHPPHKIRLIASHTDSPSFKLKPQPEIRNRNMILLGVEVYGAPLLSSWLNRDLGLAGRVIFYNQNGQLECKTVRLDESPLTIPQLAIHLDREVNEKGLQLKKQEHLNALAAFVDDSWDDSNDYLDTLLRKKLRCEKIVNFDLFLFPLEPASFLGYGEQMVAAYRIDNLASLHASLDALIENDEPLTDEIKMLVSWDNEEIGSGTAQGASSTFVPQAIERIALSFGLTREDYFRMLSQSLCVSVDLAHALNPNYGDKHDPNHPILAGKGVVLKTNAQYRYASDAFSSIALQVVAERNGMCLQKFVSRNDIPCGSTIGPIHATLCGMPTVDIGAAQLSMHSCRELMAVQDHIDLCNLLGLILELPHLPQIDES
jgi:aspartyl aminopeptidase